VERSLTNSYSNACLRISQRCTKTDVTYGERTVSVRCRATLALPPPHHNLEIQCASLQKLDITRQVPLRKLVPLSPNDRRRLVVIVEGFLRGFTYQLSQYGLAGLLTCRKTPLAWVYPQALLTPSLRSWVERAHYRRDLPLATRSTVRPVCPQRRSLCEGERSW
jgi:hypothetical protein